MNIWMLRNWEKDKEKFKRCGVRVRYEKEIDPEVKRACKEFINWLRKNYVFPLRVNIYIKRSEFIRAMDGDLVYGTCFLPYERHLEPYIKVATGDYLDDVNLHGKDNALAGILCSIAHELTHYFQWINDIELTAIGEERQASNYSDKIIDEYAETREHP